ncbi:MAG: type II toxin-antitoxin system VapC family toxin [Treponema sp.]|nr:type II toxin-antitoxin system VapC family toxin [Treponema sp.]
MQSCVFDACAVITYLNDEPGSDIVEALLKEAADGETDIYISIVNLIEVHYANIRSLGSEKAAQILESILALPVKVIREISPAVFEQASRIKAAYRCSLADAIGLATAMEMSGRFVTSDHHELEAVARNEPVAIAWLPPHPKSRH